MKNMKFLAKNATVFEFSQLGPEQAQLLANKPWVAPLSGEASSNGFVKPTTESETLVKQVGDLAFFAFKESKKILPASVVNEEVDRLAKNLEDSTGCRVGRKERKLLKEEVITTLLAKAFVKHSTTFGWFDFGNGKLVIAASGTKPLDVVRVIDACLWASDIEIILKPWAPSEDTGRLLTSWVEHDSPAHFSIDDRITLKGAEGQSVKVIDDNATSVATPLIDSRECAELAMTYDGKVSFSITSGMQIKRIDYLDISSITEADPESYEQQCAAEMALSGLTVRGLVAALEEAVAAGQQDKQPQE